MPTMHIQYNGEDQRTLVLYANGDSELLFLTSVGPGLFRLEESSLLGEGYYHDTIRASVRDDRSLQFHEILSRSGLHTEEWILSKDLIESSEFPVILDWIINVDGNWERAFGGLLLVHVPPYLADTIHDRISSLLPKSSG